jgi:hypothetical protein
MLVTAGSWNAEATDEGLRAGEYPQSTKGRNQASSA